MGGKGGGGKSWGKGKGKGKGGRKKMHTEKTLWVGNIPAGVKFQDLKKHVDQADPPCKWAEVFFNKGKGTGAIGYGSAEEAQSAMSQINGSILNGSALEVHTWEKQKK